MLRVRPGAGEIHQSTKAVDRGPSRSREAARGGASRAQGSVNKTPRILKACVLRDKGARVFHSTRRARRLLAAVTAHPDVERAEIAGSIRRHREVIRDVDIVAACRGDPATVATSFTRASGVRSAVGVGGQSVSITFVDGTHFDLYCATPAEFAVALWRATGSDEHVARVGARLAERGLVVEGEELREVRTGCALSVPDEVALYRAAGLAYVPPELREGMHEIDAAERDAIPTLVDYADIQGVLHCHSNYSDGAATIEEMARAAPDSRLELPRHLRPLGVRVLRWRSLARPHSGAT